MKRLMISGFAAVALLAIATTMLWSHSHLTGHAAPVATAMSLKSADVVNKLPTEDFEDMSLVFSNAPKH